LELEVSSGPRGLLPTAVILIAIFFLAVASRRPPEPKQATVPATEFSAGRARAVLRRLVGDGVPHPAGSAANDIVRDRVLAEFSTLGYQPQVQTGFACDEYGTCATAKNILARLEGTEPGPTVLLAAHYDSVPAGPGASDDGAGVAAVLEIARALKSFAAPRHSIIFLIDDAEEAGMIGARVFVDQSPWAKDVRAVVNLEARGTSGPSLMFETGSANYWAVQLYSKFALRPVTNSIFYEAYKQLPNDTDFTVFKTVDYQGLNFAFIGGVNQYHTPLDNLENSSARSLQHHGENALPLVLALANGDIANPPHTDGVFFDIFERHVILWPAKWTLPLAIIALVLLYFQIGWLMAKGRLHPAALLWGAINWLAIIVTTGVLALILHVVLRTVGANPANWPAHPLPLQAAFWSLAVSVVIVLSIAFAARAGFWGMWAGGWLWWTLLSVIVAWLTHGISFILLVPSCVAVVVGLFFTMRRTTSLRGLWLVATLPLFTAGIIGFPSLFFLYDGLGVRLLAGTALIVAILFTPASSLLGSLRGSKGLARFTFPGATISVAIIAIFAAVVAPPYSAKSPERVNLQYRQDTDSGKSQWVVYPDSGRLPDSIRVATNFHRDDHGMFPWETQAAFVADSPHLALAPPTLTILQSSALDGKHQYRVLLRSERGAPDAMVFFPPDSGLAGVRIQDQTMQPESSRVRRFLNGWEVYDCPTMPTKGIEISFELPAGKQVEVYALDRTYGLPLEGMFLLKSRQFTATPSGEGDVTIVSRRVQLNP
jgi:Peptidase family M28